MRRCLLPALVAAIAAAAVTAQPTVSTVAAQPKRLLLVTHSGGFMHDSIGVAEDVLIENGRKYGFTVTCYRFTGDPDERIKVYSLAVVASLFVTVGFLRLRSAFRANRFEIYEAVCAIGMGLAAIVTLLSVWACMTALHFRR